MPPPHSAGAGYICDGVGGYQRGRTRRSTLRRGCSGDHFGELSHRHATYYCSVAEDATPNLYGQEVKACLDLLDREHDNFRAALGWAIERGEAETGAIIAAKIGGEN